MADGANSDFPIYRIFIGNTLNPQHETIVQGGINLVKGAVSQIRLIPIQGIFLFALTSNFIKPRLSKSLNDINNIIRGMTF